LGAAVSAGQLAIDKDGASAILAAGGVRIGRDQPIDQSLDRGPFLGVKKTHGPGLTDWGGSPANGRQGIPAPPANVRALAARATGSIAVEANSARRVGRPAECLAPGSVQSGDVGLTSAELADMAHPR
jgi:hypothetical protein